MKRLCAAPTVAVALLLGACSGGGYGTVGPPDLTGANGDPGGSVTPPSAGTALFQLQRRRAALPERPVFRRLDRWHAQHPATQRRGTQPGRDQRARRLLHHGGNPRALRRGARPELVHAHLGDRAAGDHRQRHQGDDRRGRSAAHPGRRLHGRTCSGRRRRRLDPRDHPAAPAQPEHLHRQRPVPGSQLQDRQRLPRVPHLGHQGRRRPCRASPTRTTAASRPRSPAGRPARASPTRR